MARKNSTAHLDWARRISACVAIVATVSVLAACSSSGSSSTCSGGGSTSASTANKSPVKIFVTSSFTGTAYSDPQVLSAAEAAADSINAAGGIKGHPVSIVGCDDQLSPSVATQCAQKALSEKPIAVTGEFIYAAQTFAVLT